MKYSYIFVAAIFALLATGSANAGEKCKCRFNGGYIDEGKTACLKTPNGFSLARCEKVLNNTSWTRLNQPCPIAGLELQDNFNGNQTPFPAKQIASLIPKS